MSLLLWQDSWYVCSQNCNVLLAYYLHISVMDIIFSLWSLSSCQWCDRLCITRCVSWNFKLTSCTEWINTVIHTSDHVITCRQSLVEFQLLFSQRTRKTNCWWVHIPTFNTVLFVRITFVIYVFLLHEVYLLPLQNIHFKTSHSIEQNRVFMYYLFLNTFYLCCRVGFY